MASCSRSRWITRSPDRRGLGAGAGQQRAFNGNPSTKRNFRNYPQLSPNDEFANYEILNYLLGGAERAPRIHGSYVRESGVGGRSSDGGRPRLQPLQDGRASARATLIIPRRVTVSPTISVATVSWTQPIRRA